METNDYIRGYLTALRDFAWWRGGIEYVGCGIYTLKRATEEFLNEQGIITKESK